MFKQKEKPNSVQEIEIYRILGKVGLKTKRKKNEWMKQKVVIEGKENTNRVWEIKGKS